MTREEGTRGALAVGQLADLAVLSDDYFAVPDEDLKALESVLTILGGKPVYGAEEFTPFDPGALPVMPDWSPVQRFPGAWRGRAPQPVAPPHALHATTACHHANRTGWLSQLDGWLDHGCDCFAF
jgi:hypothetical protein